MRLVVDTGVFSAALSRRRRQLFDTHVEALRGNQLFLSVVTVAELRYGAIVADWGSPRRERVEAAISATTVVPVTDALLSAMAELRADCRRIGHPLADPVHGTTCGLQPLRRTSVLRSSQQIRSSPAFPA